MESLSEERENCGHSAALSVRPKHSANKPHFSPVTSVMPAGLSHSGLLLSSSEKTPHENYPSSEAALWRHPRKGYQTG